MSVVLANKKCSRCGEEKDLSLFPKQRTYCKKCHNKQSNSLASHKKWIEQNKEKSAEYTRKWRLNNKERFLLQKQEHRKEKRKEINEYNRLYRKNNKAVVRAHESVKWALKTGALKREPCFCCGAKAMAHHPSYAEDMRLNVVWLCAKHHAEAHA